MGRQDGIDGQDAVSLAGLVRVVDERSNASEDTERNTRCAGIWRIWVDARRPGYQSAAESAYNDEYVDAAAVWGAERSKRERWELCSRTAAIVA